MRKTSRATLAALVFCAHAAHAQDVGCKEVPVLTPARDTAGDLRCFPQRLATRAPDTSDSGHASIFSIVLASVGGAGIATFIGFGLGGQSLFGNGDVSSSTVAAVRADYAVANVALSVGITALVTSIVLVLTHH
jgi:hypothetical protein